MQQESTPKPHLRGRFPAASLSPASGSSADEASTTPPSSPGSSSAGFDNGSLSSTTASDKEAALRRRRERRRERERVRGVRRPRRSVLADEAISTRGSRFLLTLLCYAPFFWLWSGPLGGTDLPGLQEAPICLLATAAAVAFVKESLRLHWLAVLYPLLSFCIGVVGGRGDVVVLRVQQLPKLLAVCCHGIIAGQLRSYSKQTGVMTSSLNPLGGFVTWLCIGEVVAHVLKGTVPELLYYLSAYALLALVPVVLSLLSHIITTGWVAVFGVERSLSSSSSSSSFLVRALSAVVWVVTAFSPLLLTATTAVATLYFMLPIIWDRMLFVAPWGVLLEFGSALSCGGSAHSMFWTDAIVPVARRA